MDNATFMCTAEGLPRPNITWFRLLNEVPQALPVDRFSVQTMDGPGERTVTSVLTIENAQPALAGMYVCNATNEVALDTEFVNLLVHSECIAFQSTIGTIHNLSLTLQPFP